MFVVLAQIRKYMLKENNAVRYFKIFRRIGSIEVKVVKQKIMSNGKNQIKIKC